MKNSNKILDVHFDAYNGEDRGKCGYWAVINARIEVIAWQLSTGEIYVVAKVDDIWNTIKGARAPNSKNCTVLQKADASGNIKEIINAYLPKGTTITLEKTCGYVGTFDLGGSYSDLLLPADDQKPPISPITIINSFFSNPLIIINITAEYYFCDELLWIDTDTGFAIGDVIIDKNGCPI
ncbi:MAG: hypothetical protein Harvfovirus27_17 [Harvfovirus sp.]|uniref:Uncharacterized protein n=1 Tax=Harvfovirus sp. TaxID=2487768 RepID=A0A3G5A272_9VIRU|nr:MAG: hypothetical protein Harvfovirus27_17 [Harvfovirus sp.]